MADRRRERRRRCRRTSRRRCSTRITEQSLDEDYQQVAARKAARGGGPTPPGRPRLGAAAVGGRVFGVLVATAAVQTSRNADVDDAEPRRR